MNDHGKGTAPYELVGVCSRELSYDLLLTCPHHKELQTTLVTTACNDCIVYFKGYGNLFFKFCEGNSGNYFRASSNKVAELWNTVHFVQKLLNRIDITYSAEIMSDSNDEVWTFSNQ